MKRKFLLTLFLTLGITCFTMAQSHAVSVSLDVLDDYITIGESFDVEVWVDSSDISWDVNDTDSFAITNGLITNSSVLGIGAYNLEVSVSDQYGNTLSCNLQIVIISDSTAPLDPILLFFMPTIGIGAVVVAAIVYRRRS